MAMDTRIENPMAEFEDVLHSVRARVANAMGEAFAAKASPSLCMQIVRPVQHAMAEILEASAAPGPVVLEFVERPEVTLEIGRSAEVLRSSKAWGSLLRSIQKLRVEPVTSGTATEVFESGVSDPEILPLRAANLLRHLQLSSARDNFLKVSGAITDVVERGAARFGGLRSGALGVSAFGRAPITEVCWLNRTVRSWADPRVLAEVATDQSIERFDLPQLLEPELDVTTKTVGAAQYRKNHKVSGKGIIVAVIDSEVALSHPALKGRVVHKKNYTNEPWGTPGSHGTAVAGIIASADKNYPGVAPEATIYCYKVLSENPALRGDDFDGALAIQRALEDDVHIANCSWGAGLVGNAKSRKAKACDAAWNLGLVIVKSAGNRGPGAGTCTVPAEADGIIVVGATDRQGSTLGDYSSRGPAVDRVRPHLVAPGGGPADGVISCLVGGGFGNVGYGTSYAAPHVSGLLALLLQREPNLTPDDLRERLIAASTPLAGLDANDQGAGLVSF